MSSRIVIVGLGLIGGSIAKALKANTPHQVLGMDQDEDTLLDACSMGAIDGKATVAQLKTADIVYLCIYPEAAVDFVKTYGKLLKKDCIVTDTCGVKKEVCRGIAAVQGDFVFVAGHPMAGKEFTGFSASDAGLFMGASYILVPGQAPQWAVDQVGELALAMGFGRLVKCTAEKHDRMIAFTSQVPHVLACAYVLSPQCKEHRGFSAGSYRDVSRVANINATLWSRLFLDNREDLVEELEELVRNISRIKEAVAQEDEAGLLALLGEAAQRKRQDQNG